MPCERIAVLFLSHSGADTEEAKSLATLLRQAGIEVWIDVENLQPGSRWMEELERALRSSDSFAVYVGRSGVQRWVDREVRFALERNTVDAEFRVFPILGPGANPSALPLFLSQHQRLDLASGLTSPEQLKALIGTLLDLPLEKAVLLPSGKAPFLGLHAFDVEDALLFYGRDREVEELLDRLQQQRFLAVIGDSGCGKSSLVRAGLIPSLIRGRFHDGKNWIRSWRVAVLRPDDDPFRELANALPDLDAYGQVRNDVRRACEHDLREGATGLYNSIASLVRPGDCTLIIVDQFEELFTLGSRGPADAPASNRKVAEARLGVRDRQNRFIDCLLTAADAAGDRPDRPVYVVITLRADFYAQCWQHSQLPQRIAASQYAVRRIPPEKLRETIEIPLSLVGAKAEPGLVRTILEDVGDAPGSLPLLEHALELLWEARIDNSLTHAAYEDIGRLKGAIRKYADNVYDHLAPAEQQAVEQMMLRLTQLGEGTEDTRRTARVSELVSIGDPALTRKVLTHLADARLVTVSGDISTSGAGSNNAIVEVCHEALIREWPRLRDWIERNRDSLRTSRRLEAAALDWRRADYPAKTDYLYQGARLAEAEEWAGKQDRIPEGVREFLVASSTARETAAMNEITRQRELTRQAEARAEVEERLRKEADRRRITGRRFSYALGAALLLVGGAGIIALRQQTIAHQQQSIAESRALAAQSQLTRDTQLDLASLLSIEAGKAKETVESRSALLGAAESNPALLTYLRHLQVVSVASSPDGRTLASASTDRTIRLWDVSTEAILGEPLRGHTDIVWGVTFSSDGKLLASASQDGTVRLWDVATRRALGEPLKGHTNGVRSVAFSPDGKTLVSGGDDLTVRFWDLTTKNPLGEPLKGHTDAVLSVAFSPNGKTVASAGDKTVRLWDVASRHVQVGTPGDYVERATFSPDGKLLALATNKTVQLWDVDKWRALGDPMKGHTGIVADVAFSRDGKTLASGGGDRTVRLWNVAKRTPLGELLGHTDSVDTVAFSSDGKTLVSGSEDGTVRLWDPARRGLGAELNSGTPFVLNVAFSPDGVTLALAGQDGTVRLLDVTTGKPRGELNGHTDIVRGVAFSPDGKMLASASNDHTVRLWDVASKRALGDALRGHTEIVFSVAFSPDGQTVASSSGDGTVRLWSTATRHEIGTPLIGPFHSSVLGVAFSPDGKTLASGDFNGFLSLWDVARHLAVGEALSDHKGAVTAVAFSPDGKILASSSEDQTVRLWDVATRKALGEPLRGHTDSVEGVAFSPDGTTLASASKDQTVRLWDVAARQSLGEPLRGHAGRVRGVAFSPNGKTLASVGDEQTILLWNVDPAYWVARACARANRNLSLQEWAFFIGKDAPYQRTCPNLPPGEGAPVK